MDYEILNNGEPDDEGMITAIIRNTDGRITSKFREPNYEDLAKRVLESQVNANREIARLRKPDAAREPLKVSPKELTAADRLRLSTEITDPSRVIEAVDEILTARQGISPDKLGAELSRMSEEEQIKFGMEQVDLFLKDYPSYYPVPQNREAMEAELQRNNWQPTRNNLALAYHNLQDKLVPWPAKGETADKETRPNPEDGNGQVPTTMPRARTIATTGLRSADASALPPAPQPKKLKYTRADIERMSRAEYTDKLHNEPGFRQQVDAMA